MVQRKQPFHRPSYGYGLTSYDFPATSVTVTLGLRADMPEEGEEDHVETVLIFPDAFYHIEAEYYVVYTEHYGYHTFSRDVVLGIDGKQVGWG